MPCSSALSTPSPTGLKALSMFAYGVYFQLLFSIERRVIMTTVGDVTINVIFPIQQKLYDAVMEQVHSTGASLDSLYCDACAGCFAQLPGVEQSSTHILRSFQLEELGNRATMGGLMQATLVLSPD